MTINYLAFIGGELMLAADEEQLIGHAIDAHATTFIAWQVSREHSDLLRILIQQVGENWRVVDAHGGVRMIYKESRTDLHREVCSLVTEMRPVVGMIVDEDAFRELHPPTEAPLYTPFGFTTPVHWNQHPVMSQWVFDWCPDIVCDQVENLSPDQRLAYLKGVYARLNLWTVAAERGVPADKRDVWIDNVMYERHAEVLAVVGLVQMEALEKMNGG